MVLGLDPDAIDMRSLFAGAGVAAAAVCVPADGVTVGRPLPVDARPVLRVTPRRAVPQEVVSSERAEVRGAGPVAPGAATSSVRKVEGRVAKRGRAERRLPLHEETHAAPSCSSWPRTERSNPERS